MIFAGFCKQIYEKKKKHISEGILGKIYKITFVTLRRFWPLRG